MTERKKAVAKADAEDDLAPVFDAFDKETGGGRDDEYTRELSDAYVEKNPDKFEAFSNLSLDECVRRLEALRDAGDESWKEVQVWLWHQFEPQNIGGVYEPKLRVTNNGN